MTRNHTIAVFIASLLFFSSAAIALSILGGDDDKNVIWKSGVNLYFKYTQQDDAGFGKNDHPVDLDEKDISNALQSLNIEDKGFFSTSVDIKPVFPPQQVKLLSENLSKGLNNAKPDQDIIFVMGKSYTKLHFLTQRAFVTGRAFYKDGKLNLIVGDYDLERNEALESVYDPSGKGDVPYTFNLGYRSQSSSSFKQEIIQTAGVENKILEHERRQNWFVIDVKTAADAFLAKKNGKNKANDAVTNAAIQQEAEQLARERRQLRLEMAKMRKEMQEGKEGTNKEGMNKEKTQLTTEERLGQLEELHKKKLISEDEYKQKRKEILDDI